MSDQEHFSVHLSRESFLRGEEVVGRLFCRGPDGCGSWSFFAFFNLKFNRLAFLYSIKVHLLQGAAVEENLLAVGRPEKSEAAVTNQTFDCAFHRHLSL